MQRHPIALYVVAVALAVLAALAFVDRGVSTRLDTDTRNFTGDVDTLLGQADEASDHGASARARDPNTRRAGTVSVAPESR